MGARNDGAAAETLRAAERPAAVASTVSGLFCRWHGLGGELDLNPAPDAEVQVLLERRLNCRMRMAGAQSRSLAEIRMKLAVLHAELADGLEPGEAEDAANLALLGSALADLLAFEETGA